MTVMQVLNTPPVTPGVQIDGSNTTPSSAQTSPGSHPHSTPHSPTKPEPKLTFTHECGQFARLAVLVFYILMLRCVTLPARCNSLTKILTSVTTISKVHSHGAGMKCMLLSGARSCVAAVIVLLNAITVGLGVLAVLLCSAETAYSAADSRQQTVHMTFGLCCLCHLITCASSAATLIAYSLCCLYHLITCAASAVFLSTTYLVSWGVSAMTWAATASLHLLPHAAAMSYSLAWGCALLVMTTLLSCAAVACASKVCFCILLRELANQNIC